MVAFQCLKVWNVIFKSLRLWSLVARRFLESWSVCFNESYVLLPKIFWLFFGRFFNIRARDPFTLKEALHRATMPFEYVHRAESRRLDREEDADKIWA